VSKDWCSDDRLQHQPGGDTECTQDGSHSQGEMDCEMCVAHPEEAADYWCEEDRIAALPFLSHRVGCQKFDENSRSNF